jgi:hypothetical protein
MCIQAADLLFVTQWDKWTAIGTIAAAAATLFLALVTLWLVVQTRAELTIERHRIEAAQRPRVFPAPPTAWTDGADEYAGRWPQLLPVKNGGPGVALNVRLRLQWPPPSGIFVQSVTTNLAPGDFTDLRLDWGATPNTDWNNITGKLTYEDVVGALWQTEFRVFVEHDRYRYIELYETRLLTRAGRTNVSDSA